MTRREAMEHVSALGRGGVRRACAEAPEGAYETLREPGGPESTRLVRGWGGKKVADLDPSEVVRVCDLDPPDAGEWQPGPLPWWDPTTRQAL
jgi:hypothetical protein